MIVVTVDPLAEIFLEDVGDKRHSSGMVVGQQPLTTQCNWWLTSIQTKEPCPLGSRTEVWFEDAISPSDKRRLI